MTLTEFNSTDKAITSVVAHSDAGHCKIRQVLKLRTSRIQRIGAVSAAVMPQGCASVFVHATSADAAMDVQESASFSFF